MSMKKFKSRFDFRVSVELKNRLAEESNRSGVPISEIIRRAIEMYLNKTKGCV